MGSRLELVCGNLTGCRTGEAKLTCGYRLSARFVIHTVGPAWRDGHADEDNLLASCYRSVFKVAAEHGLRSLAFAPISAGTCRFPVRVS